MVQIKYYTPDTWNGTDGNTHSQLFPFNENTSALTFWNDGIDGDCKNNTHWESDVSITCFMPHEESPLYHHGCKLNNADTDERTTRDFFECPRNKYKPSIGISESLENCNQWSNGSKNEMIIMIITIISFIL